MEHVLKYASESCFSEAVFKYPHDLLYLLKPYLSIQITYMVQYDTGVVSAAPQSKSRPAGGAFLVQTLHVFKLV